MATVFQLFQTVTDTLVQRFGCESIEVFVAKGAGKYLFSQLAFKSALRGLQGKFAYSGHIHVLVDQKPDNMVELALFKPLFQHHECLLDTQPFLGGRAAIL